MTSKAPFGPHILVVRLVVLILMPFSEDMCFSAVLKGVESRTWFKDGLFSGSSWSLVSSILITIREYNEVFSKS